MTQAIPIECNQCGSKLLKKLPYGDVGIPTLDRSCCNCGAYLSPILVPDPVAPPSLIVKITLGIGAGQPRTEEIEVTDLGHTPESWLTLNDNRKRNAIWEYINEDGWLDLGYQELT